MVTALELRQAADRLESVELARSEQGRLELQERAWAAKETERQAWWRQHESQFAVVKAPRVVDKTPEWLSSLRELTCPWDSLPLGLPGGVSENVSYPTSTLFLTCKLGHNHVARWSEKGYQVDSVILE